MVLLEDISKSFGELNVLKNVTVDVPTGSTVALIGPSGCGKSTLLRMVVGLLWPDRGRVVVGDKEVSPETAQQIRHRLGYVIQDGGLFPHLTAQENAALAARFQGWKRDRIEQRVRELAELTHLPVDSLQRYPAQISGGQRQRVSLMRALMLDPDVLLMDEPLGALDPMIRHELQEDLKTIFRSLGKTVLMVTHDLHEAAWFADKIVLLKNGEIEQQGSVSDFVTNPATQFVSDFLQAQRTGFEQPSQSTGAES